MQTNDWKNTRLWIQLELLTLQSAENVRTLLSLHMPGIQDLLRQGGTAPPDFTLHDDRHSFRVAQRMVDIIPNDSFVALSPYELGLLLLSAYLHDIGMTPKRQKVSSHYQYLITGKSNLLDEDEISDFQEWLDDYHGGVVPPLSSAQLTTEVLDAAGFIITHYCRARHNDWSEDWIRENLSRSKMGTYNGWLDDLVTLCRSHHYGYQELRKDQFDPRPVAGGDIVHLRYLACMLRVADILEFDPERTPDVIFQHRSPHPSSKIFWWKDHEITLVLEGDELVISAQPEHAYVHKAVEMTADQVDEELRICSQLATERHFEKCPGLTRELPHKWMLPPAVRRNIKPRGDAYEYIDGAFRPDTKKLLELLSGTELYGSPIVAVRELLQNAFDAVREQIAYERLELPNPAERSSAELDKQHFVNLSVEEVDGNLWLVCEDNGVGMTKRIIADYLLVSGRGVRHEILDLDRRCEAAGFSLGRTGQFGIGVLSYFMLASSMIFETRRSQESGSAEATGWRFETDGIGSFGELRSNANLKKGTTVRLRLRPKVTGGDISSWCRQLEQYLRETLVRIPCRFEFADKTANITKFKFGPGWTRSHKDFTEMVVNDIVRRGSRFSAQGDVPEELLPLEIRAERESIARNWEALSCEIRQAIRWETKETLLPNGLGVYRIHSCYFDLPRGRSLAFLRVKEQEGILSLEKIGKGYSILPSGFSISAWKGIRLGFDRGDRLPGQYGARAFMHRRNDNSIVEIDILSNKAGSIAVDRNAARLDTSVQGAFAEIVNTALASLKTLTGPRTDSVYSSLNSVLMDEPISISRPPYWITVQENGTTEWKEVNVPAISSLTFAYSEIPSTKLVWNGRPVSVVRSLGEVDAEEHYKGLVWHGSSTSPDRVVAFLSSRLIFELVPLWEDLGERTSTLHPLGLTSQFAPTWRHLVGVKFSHYHGTGKSRIVWNPENPLVAAVNRDAWLECQDRMQANQDPLAHREWILSDRAYASSWIADCLVKEKRELWDGLKDRNIDFLPQVYKLVFGDSKGAPAISNTVHFFVEDGYSSRLRALHVSEWSITKEPEKISSVLADPGLQWRLQFERSSTERMDVRMLRSFSEQKTSGRSKKKKRKTTLQKSRGKDIKK